jgi:hypothetical protein
MLTRRQRIVTFAVLAIVVSLALAWVGWLSAPTPPPSTVAIANVQNLEVDHGLRNAIVFPFQLAPDAQPNEEGVPTVASAGISVSFQEPACAASVQRVCPGLTVAVFTSDAAGLAGAGGNVTPLWCAVTNGSACGPASNGSYQVDLTPYAGQPLDLVVWTTTGIGWADLSATGSWTG